MSLYDMGVQAKKGSGNIAPTNLQSVF